MSLSTNAYRAADEYARLGLRTSIESASPHRLILMLIEGADDKLRLAHRAMQTGEVAAKGANISWAISIIDGLRASLNLERGGEIAANLDSLYDYMSRTLLAANLHNDLGKLEEVGQLLNEIRQAWKGIEHQVDGDGSSKSNNDIGPNAVAVVG